MADLTVIVPSRERPTAAGPLVEAFKATCTTDTRLVFAVDESDPTQQDYIDVAFGANWPVSVFVCPSRTMVEALNHAAGALLADGAGFAIGFLGDDHCPRTVGWDTAYLETLHALGTGMVYGDDLLQGERIPTQVAMTSDIVSTLGHMAPPVLTHLYVDNYWLDLGRQAGCLRYLPDVVVEHRHPFAGKAAMDAGYARVNDAGMYDRDGQAYAAYAPQLATDIAKVKALRGDA